MIATRRAVRRQRRESQSRHPGARAHALPIWRRAGRADRPRPPLLLRQLRSQYPGSGQQRRPGGTAADQAQLPFDVDRFCRQLRQPVPRASGLRQADLAGRRRPSGRAERQPPAWKPTCATSAGRRRASAAPASTTTSIPGRLRWDWNGNGFLNEGSIDYLQLRPRNSAPLGDAGFGQIYQGVIQVGGRADFQDRAAGRPDLPRQSQPDRHRLERQPPRSRWALRVSFQNYRVGGTGPNANPQFEFIRDDRAAPGPADDLTFAFPANVRFGGGDPERRGEHHPDRPVRPGRLGGERASHDQCSACAGTSIPTASNNDFVTSPAAAAALADAGRRPADPAGLLRRRGLYLDRRQPEVRLEQFRAADRLLLRLQRAISAPCIFGGYGRYYDRALFRSAAEETLLSQYRSGELLFSADGLPRDGRPTILWNPAI